MFGTFGVCILSSGENKTLWSYDAVWPDLSVGCYLTTVISALYVRQRTVVFLHKGNQRKHFKER